MPAPHFLLDAVGERVVDGAVEVVSLTVPSVPMRTSALTISSAGGASAAHALAQAHASADAMDRKRPAAMRCPSPESAQDTHCQRPATRGAA
jgi:hypothetical protein